MFSRIKARNASIRSMHGFVNKLRILNAYLERVIMMKKTIRFVFSELFQEEKRNSLLQAMAKQGWSLAKTYGPLWMFQAQEKADVRYSSFWHYFKNGEDEKKKDMIAFVEDSGWHYVTSCGSLHIFKTEDDAALPLETDAVMTIMALHKTMMKTAVLPILFVILFVGYFTFSQLNLLFTEPLYAFGGDGVNYGLFVMGWFVLSAIAGIAFLISYFNWHHKAVHTAIEEGVVSSFTPFPFLVVTMALLYFGAVIFWIQRLTLAEDSAIYRILLIFMGGLMALLSYMQYRVMKEERNLRSLKRAAVLVVLGVVCCGVALFVPERKKDTTLSIEQAPLVKADFMESASIQYQSVYEQKNILFDKLDIYQYEGENAFSSFGYTYVNSHLEILNDALFNNLLQWMETSYGGTFVESDPKKYGTDVLYILHDEDQ